MNLLQLVMIFTYLDKTKT